MFDLKLIASVLKEAGRVDLHSQLLEFSEKLREQEELIHKLEKENRSLREADDLKARVHVRDEMYYVRQDDGSDDGPFCTRCYDIDGKLSRLKVADYDQARCPQCKTWQGPSKEQLLQGGTIDPYDPLADWSSR